MWIYRHSSVVLLKGCIPVWKFDVAHVLLVSRAAIEYDKKESTENYDHGKLMEQNLISTARELEKLRAQIANAEKRARAAAAVGDPATFICGLFIIFFYLLLVSFEIQ